MHVYIYSKVTHCAGHILADNRPHQLCCMHGEHLGFVNLFLTPSTETSSTLQVNRNLINTTGQQKHHQHYRSTETSSMHATGIDCLVTLNVAPVVQVNYRTPIEILIFTSFPNFAQNTVGDCS